MFLFRELVILFFSVVLDGVIAIVEETAEVKICAVVLIEVVRGVVATIPVVKLLKIELGFKRFY
jgi:hypothetical protein